ncbi:ATP-binding protein [Haloarchaeobius baliensis]|uniref:sensor histidine kinase n=1 Tax=Haloarchaeobius baliensis TaxID=1670458 RepID=UPI003F884349
MSAAPAAMTVLHVDDEEEFTALTAELLERQSDRIGVVSATTADEALDLLERETIDCVVSDYEMSGTDGLELLAAVRERHEGLPFILFTGRGSEEIASEAISAGVTDYLRKGGGSDQFALLANRIENAVEQARSRLSYRAVFENTDVGLTVRDVETGTVVDVNQQYCDLLGYDREQLGELGLEDITADVPGYDAERGVELLERALAEPEFTFEWPDRRSDGSTHWVEVDATLVEIEGRERSLVTIHDVHERHEREAVLATLHQVATEIQECETIEAACERTVAAAESILEFEMCSLMVAEGGWLVPKAVSTGAPTDGARRMRQDQGLAGKTYQTGESTLVEDVLDDDVSEPAKTSYRSGISVPIGESGVFQAVATEPNAFSQADVELAELLVSHTARVLDRLRFEGELRRQNERLEEFASVVSHDLRNPLTVALGKLELVREESDSEHLAHLGDALERMSSITEDTLQLARHGGSVDDTHRIDLATFADRCWTVVQTDEATLTVADATIRADRNRLRHIFENLFRNAVEHATPDDGSAVSITVGVLPGGFYVADDGVGIPESERDRVFDPGHTTTEEGTGFGLAIVEEFAAAHGWTVQVTEGDDGGARFEFTGVEVLDRDP